jgi:cation diffusion facilitator CzcD-associated flavoprotein CzcO
LFKDFCASLEAGLSHEWLRGTATEVRRDAGKFRVRYTADHLAGSGWVVASAVVLATGATGERCIPPAFASMNGRVVHTEELFRDGRTLAERFARTVETMDDPGPRRVLVIGGGITAAQVALAGVEAGFTVVLRSRRPLVTRAYDLSRDWLDQRHANRLRFGFLSTPMHERKEAAKEAVQGGSVPEVYMKERAYLASTSMLELQVDEKLGSSVVHERDGGVEVNGVEFDHVILATGSQAAPMSSPLFQQIQSEFDLPTLDGFPLLDGSLRWIDEEDLFVVGASAVLELGPGALNLMGAMRGATILAEALRDLVWKDGAKGKVSDAVTANMFSVQFSALSESDD